MELKRAEAEVLSKQGAEQQREEQVCRQKEYEQRAKQEAATQFYSETMQDFDRYWMPSHLKAVWVIVAVIHGVGIAFSLLALLQSFVILFITPNEEIERQFMGVLFIQSGLLIALIFSLLSTRIVLEAFAIIFDIRGLLKRQVALLESQRETQ